MDMEPAVLTMNVRSLYASRPEAKMSEVKNASKSRGSSSFHKSYQEDGSELSVAMSRRIRWSCEDPMDGWMKMEVKCSSDVHTGIAD